MTTPPEFAVAALDDPTTSPPPHPGRPGWRGGLVAFATFVVWVIGQTFRDDTWHTALCFYIPSPVIATTLLGTAVVWWRSQHRRGAMLVVGVSLLPIFMAIFIENRPFAAEPMTSTAADFRVVHWNVGSRLRSPGAIDVLVEQQADLIVLTEAGPTAGIDQLEAALGPDWHSERFAGLAVLARDPLRLGETWLERRRTMAKSVYWDHRGKAIQVLIVDMPSELNVARDPVLREINAIIEQQRPDIVVGDFNAPRRSRQLSRLPANYRHAFDTVGTGCGYTWPGVVPLLAIDQMICGPDITPVAYHVHSSQASDHRFQVFDAAINVP